MSGPGTFNVSFLAPPSDGDWKQLAILLLWKLNGGKPISITREDIEIMQAAFAPGEPVLFSQTSAGALQFQVVRSEESRVGEQGGHA